MAALVTNNASGTLASSINAVELSLTLNSGQGALFPNPTGGDYFYATLVTNANDKEIVKVTARSTNTLTIVRGQDGTTARAFTAGDRVELRFCAALHGTYAGIDDTNTFAEDQTFESDTIVEGVQVVTGAAGTDRYTEYRSGADVRWRIGVEDTAETGADAGSNFEIRAYGDDEILQALAVTINRATGATTLLEGSKVGSNKIDALAAGDKLVFRQAAVPSGWTKDTTYNNAALRVTSGTPSQQTTAGNEFTTLLAERTIARANLPNVTLAVTGSTSSDGLHGHPYREARIKDSGVSNGGLAISVGNEFNVPEFTGTPTNINGRYIGGAGLHDHTVTGTAASINGGVTQTVFNLDVNYVDLYIATKDA